MREAAFSQRFLNPNPLILKPPNALGIREIFWGHWRNLFPSVSVCSILHHIRDSKRLSIFFSRFKDSAIALVNLKQFRVIGKTPFIIYLLLFETFRNGDFFFCGGSGRFELAQPLRVRAPACVRCRRDPAVQ